MPRRIFPVISEQTTISGATNYGPYFVGDDASVSMVRKVTTGAALSITVKYGQMDVDGNIVGSVETVNLADGEEVTLELAGGSVPCDYMLLTLPDTAVIDFLQLVAYRV